MAPRVPRGASEGCSLREKLSQMMRLAQKPAIVRDAPTQGGILNCSRYDHEQLHHKLTGCDPRISCQHDSPDSASFPEVKRPKPAVDTKAVASNTLTITKPDPCCPYSRNSKPCPILAFTVAHSTPFTSGTYSLPSFAVNRHNSMKSGSSQ